MAKNGSSKSPTIPFKTIRARAEKRKGGPKALEIEDRPIWALAYADIVGTP